MPSRFHARGTTTFRPLAESTGEGATSGRGTLQGILHFAGELDARRAQLDHALPAEVHGHWRLARLDEEQLVAVAESSAWAFRLRYLAPQLQRRCAELWGVKPKSVEVRVAPVADRPRRNQPPRPPGPDGLAAIESTAHTADNPALREALSRLARRYRNGPPGSAP